MMKRVIADGDRTVAVAHVPEAVTALVPARMIVSELGWSHQPSIAHWMPLPFGPSAAEM